MSHVPGLRSCYSRVGRLVYFGRMLDKIRLHAAGHLPADYQANLGIGFDGRACSFLGVDYAALRARVTAGGDDAEILAWCHENGGPRTDDACGQWNRFMMKIGWRDDRTVALLERIATSGLTGRPIETFFDYIDFDEGRDPVARRAWELRPARIVLIMGVAGSGKTTIGRALAAELGWGFADADDFHPADNIDKMNAGIPLDDSDRAPWLAAIRQHLLSRQCRDEDVVVTCSALKKHYRDVLLAGIDNVLLVHLKGPRDLLLARIAARTDHFMKPSLLDSQLAALEEPADALVCDITLTPDRIVHQIRDALTH